MNLWYQKINRKSANRPSSAKSGAHSLLRWKEQLMSSPYGQDPRWHLPITASRWEIQQNHVNVHIYHVTKRGTSTLNCTRGMHCYASSRNAHVLTTSEHLQSSYNLFIHNRF